MPKIIREPGKYTAINLSIETSDLIKSEKVIEAESADDCIFRSLNELRKLRQEKAELVYRVLIAAALPAKNSAITITIDAKRAEHTNTPSA
jgi:hypothetical protein